MSTICSIGAHDADAPWHLAQGALSESGSGSVPGITRVRANMRQAVSREVKATRDSLVSSCLDLGKIEVRGPDAGIFLDRVYQCLLNLKIGRAATA